MRACLSIGGAGILAGDRVVAIDGHSRPQLDGAALKQMFVQAVGTRVELRIVRDGVESTRSLILTDVL
jgi:C-terminal processing protease CtpA/Prc